MPELRRDPVTGSWVVMATERARRPASFREQPGASAVCPFCYGNEGMTPPEVLAFRPAGSTPDTPGWRVRVVPNKYPAFGAGGPPTLYCADMFCHRHATGAHEVVIHSPDHEKDLALLPRSQVEAVLRAYRERYRAACAVSQVENVAIIINHGRSAGASIEHPHSQIFASPFVPPLVRKRLDGARRYREAHGRCVYCEMLVQESMKGDRLVTRSEDFAAFVPYAARFPFEVWIVPTRHEAHFERISARERTGFAAVLQRVLLAYHRAFDNPPFNLSLQTAPCREAVDASFHWHVEMAPKFSIQAGFELGGGTMINVTLPDEAARFLRDFAES